MTDFDRYRVLTRAFRNAHEAIERTEIALTVQPPSAALLHAAVAGTAACTRAIAMVAERLIEQGPEALAETGHHAVLGDMLADLRAMRSCLHNGALLVDPVLADLSALGVIGDAVAPPHVPHPRGAWE